MKIIISEKQLDKILVETDVINEQTEATNDDRTLIVLQNRINDIIDKKEKELLDKSSVKVLVDKGGVQLQIGQKAYPMKPMVKGVYAIVIPPNSTLSFGGSAMSELAPEIEKIAEYKSLVERHPELKEQIQGGTVKGTIFTDEQNQGTFKLTITTKPMDPGDLKLAVDFGTEYPLGEFLERNKLVYKFKNGTFGTLESGAISMNLASINLRINPQQVKAVVKPVTITPMVIGDIFNFDSIDFKNPDAANQQISTFVQEIKNGIKGYGQAFIDHIKTQNPTVFGYSSIDGDPNQPITGGYKSCAGYGTRAEYDKCLSDQRAKTIADLLNKSLPELGGIIKFEGKGQTNQFGPGWTKENPTIPEQTAPNRKYFLSKIQPFTGQA